MAFQLALEALGCKNCKAMREELDEIRLSNTTLLKEIDELHTSESQAREDIQRLRDENEKKEKQSLLL